MRKLIKTAITLVVGAVIGIAMKENADEKKRDADNK